MCTRYSLHQLTALQRVLAEFGLELPRELKAHFNIPLTARVPALTAQGGAVALQPVAFGLQLPPRAGEARGLLLANARSETMLTKGAFKDAAQHRRCLLPADGFFEWEQRGAERLPHYFHAADGETMLFAGLWRAGTETAPPAAVIVTTTPNARVAPLHDRMPVILDRTAARAWLGDEPLPPEQVAALCVPCPVERLASHRVHPRMNSARHEGPDCIVPWTPPAAEPTLFD